MKTFPSASSCSTHASFPRTSVPSFLRRFRVTRSLPQYHEPSLWDFAGWQCEHVHPAYLCFARVGSTSVPLVQISMLPRSGSTCHRSRRYLRWHCKEVARPWSCSNEEGHHQGGVFVTVASTTHTPHAPGQSLPSLWK